ncbi:hypothetical protein BH24ACT3_BH24ACT3_10680 [soil metagenome]
MFPPEPASAGRARRFLGAALDGWGLHEAADAAVLLLSEVVTNAVLHAATDLTIAVSRRDGVLRVEVRDGSPRLPNVRSYDVEAATGRGLAMVELLARSWGVDARVDGKVVWFEVDAGGSPAAEVAESGRTHRAEPSSEAGRTVRYQRLPVALAWATVQHGDALLRDAALLVLSEDQPGRDPLTWQGPGLDITALLEGIKSALDMGTDAVDLVVRFPAGAGPQALQRLAAVDGADRLAHQAALLVPPSLPEVAQCRRWLWGEIVRQFDDQPPTPWKLQPSSGITSAKASFPEEQRRAVDQRGTAVVVADDGNHIVHASEPVAALLGWGPGELAGCRLTTIIPPELHEAHLAGYTRYHLTGEALLIGRPARVPALRHDGSTVEVELLLEVVSTAQGRFFVGTLTPVD